MKDKLITLMTFTYPSEAYPLMTKLESEEIECMLFDELTVLTDPFISNAIGGVKLKIRETDLPHATKILKSINFAGEKENPAKKKLQEGFAKGYVVRVEKYCPKCESAGIYRKRLSLSGLFKPKSYFCSDCGYTWEE